MDDMERAIDDAPRGGANQLSSPSRANPAFGGSSNDYEAFESVPLRGAGRSLAQRATAHLKSLKKTLKNAFSDSNTAGTSPSATRSTYSNTAFEDTVVGSPRAGQMLSRHHARSRSIDLRYVLDELEDTLEGASTAALLLKEIRESGGDLDADTEMNDALDLELSDVCKAHRAHLMQVLEMSDHAVSLSEDQLGRLLAMVEKLNIALNTVKSDIPAENHSQDPNSSAPVPIPSGRPSLGSSRIECATTEAEEEAMIAQAIAASLKLKDGEVKENEQNGSTPAVGSNALPAPSTGANGGTKTNEELLGNLIDI